MCVVGERGAEPRLFNGKVKNKNSKTIGKKILKQLEKKTKLKTISKKIRVQSSYLWVRSITMTRTTYSSERTIIATELPTADSHFFFKRSRYPKISRSFGLLFGESKVGRVAALPERLEIAHEYVVSTREHTEHPLCRDLIFIKYESLRIPPCTIASGTSPCPNIYIYIYIRIRVCRQPQCSLLAMQ